jgi:hypothetical protein
MQNNLYQTDLNPGVLVFKKISKQKKTRKGCQSNF